MLVHATTAQATAIVRAMRCGRLRSDDFALLPYRDAPDPALAERYRGLRSLDRGTLGAEFYHWYVAHGFAFPGEPDAINEAFVCPHDSTHLLSGYSTSPQGELLVSTFTAGMHPLEPMAGHILPVIFSWHLGVELSPVAGSWTVALNPRKFWVAWERGAETTGGPFSADWDFWAMTKTALEDLERRFHVPPLAPGDAATETARRGSDRSSDYFFLRRRSRPIAPSTTAPEASSVTVAGSGTRTGRIAWALPGSMKNMVSARSPISVPKFILMGDASISRIGSARMQSIR